MRRPPKRPAVFYFTDGRDFDTDGNGVSLADHLQLILNEIEEMPTPVWNFQQHENGFAVHRKCPYIIQRCDKEEYLAESIQAEL